MTLDPNVPVPLDDDPNFRPEALTRYLRRTVSQLDGPIKYFRFIGGTSNLTFLVKAAGQEFVLKREPPGAKAKSAHDMRREFRMLANLADIFPFAPRPIALCEDDSVFGGVFVVMERVDGLIVRSAEAVGDALPAQFMGLLDALADLHSIDIAKTGLEGFGRPEGYRRRQVEGWCKRFRDAATGPAVRAERIIAWLLANIPADPERAAIVHNDFKMDNLVWDRERPERLIGVLDWEMATLGDPLMDLACTLSFWVQPDDPAPVQALRAMPSNRPGVASRREALAHYVARTRSTMEDFTFYRCFGVFRRTTIEQQKFHRFSTGQTQDERFRDLDRSVDLLLGECERALEGAHV